MGFRGISLCLIVPAIALTAMPSVPVYAAATAATMVGDSTPACAALLPATGLAGKASDPPAPTLINRSLDLDNLGDDGSGRCRASDDSVAQRDTVTEIPENPTWGALLAGMAGMAVMRYRRSRPRLPLL
jgi:hypothetical protein